MDSKTDKSGGDIGVDGSQNLDKLKRRNSVRDDRNWQIRATMTSSCMKASDGHFQHHFTFSLF